MFFSHYVLEVISKERQQDLQREARMSRQSAAVARAAAGRTATTRTGGTPRGGPGRRRPARRRPAFAPALLALSRLLISAGESLRRAAYP